VKAPPVQLWIGPALICALCHALYNIFIKKGSNSIHPVLGGVILQLVAALLGGVLLSILIAKEGPEEMNYDQQGVQWAICAGLAVGSAEVSEKDHAALKFRPRYDTL
jgi:transporter family protein